MQKYFESLHFISSLLTKWATKSQSFAVNYITFLEPDGIVHKISDVQ